MKSGEREGEREHGRKRAGVEKGNRLDMEWKHKNKENKEVRNVYPEDISNFSCNGSNNNDRQRRRGPWCCCMLGVVVVVASSSVGVNAVSALVLRAVHYILRATDAARVVLLLWWSCCPCCCSCCACVVLLFCCVVDADVVLVIFLLHLKKYQVCSHGSTV